MSSDMGMYFYSLILGSLKSSPHSISYLVGNDHSFSGEAVLFLSPFSSFHTVI